MVILEHTFKDLGVDVNKTIGKYQRQKNKQMHPSDDPNSELGQKIAILSKNLEEDDKKEHHH